MLGQRPVTGPRWLSRCLLVLTALVGLGFWYGGHCIDHAATNHHRPATQAIAESSAMGLAHGDAVTRHQSAPSSSSDSVSVSPGSTAAGDCHPSTLPAATSVTVTAVHPLPAAKAWGGRPADTNTVRLAVHRPRSCQALTELGISRT